MDRVLIPVGFLFLLAILVVSLSMYRVVVALVAVLSVLVNGLVVLCVRLKCMIRTYFLLLLIVMTN